MTVPTNDERSALLLRAIRLKQAETSSRARELPRRPPEHPARLGELQTSLWLAHQMDPTSPAYNVASAFYVRGHVDVARLQRAYDEVVSKHRILRSSFRIDRSEVVQIVHSPAPSSVEVVRVAQGDGVVACTDLARKPFELENGPLIRLVHIEESAARRRIVALVLHHILADERSLGFIWREIGAAYDGVLELDAPVQYDDYVHWLGSRDPAERVAELDYWRRRLHPLPDELRLPFEKAPVAFTGASGRLLVRSSSVRAQRGMRRLAAATGVTPFTAFAFAFRLLLQRYTDGRRVAFATPVSTRSHPATAGMIGYFTNPVAVTALVDETRAVELAVRDYGRELRDVLAHASVPFEEVAEALSAPRQRDRHPVFQAMFVYQENDASPELGDARLEPLTLDLGASKFDMTLFVSQAADSLEIGLEYRSDRFDEIWMDRLLGHYQTLVEHLPEDLERATVDVPMLDAEETEQIRTVAQGVTLQTDAPPLPQQILDRVLTCPESLAVIAGADKRTYAELGAMARSIARELSARGVKPGDRVGVFLERSVAMVAALIGAHWAGAAYVPLDPSYPEARNRDVLEDAAVAAVLTSTALRRRLPPGGWTAITLDDRPSDGPQAADIVNVSGTSSAYILYTSGSSGRPKGVVVTHDNLRASTAARVAVYDTSPKRFLLVPSVAFDSSVAGLFWTLAAGGALVVPTDEQVRDARRLAELIASQQVTSLLCVPSLYAQLLETSGEGGESLQSLENAIVAGESCSSRLVHEHFRLLPHARLFNEYGPTEATVWATVDELSREDGSRSVSIGRPIPGVRVDVVDTLGRPVPAGIAGHAWIAGETVAQGYWNRPDLTAERFVVDNGDHARRYRTGDLMARTLDGRLLFLGRDDEQIKMRGFRIEPGEIEAALLELPWVAHAAVVARGSPAQLVAFVESRGGANVEGWRQALAARLPEHMIPTRLICLEALPRLPNEKIHRRLLLEMPLGPEAPTAEDSRVPSTREQALLALWEGLLGRSGIRVNDNFFELGGHSLLVVEMTLAIARDFEVELRAADVFDNPTVRELASRIEQSGGAEAPPYEHLFPIQPSGRGAPLIVAIPHFFAQMFAARFRGERPVYGLRGVSLRSEGNRGRWRTMAELGDELVEEISRRFPSESVIIAGYSFGASMAIETVRRMEQRGLPVLRLILIAPMALDIYRWGPIRVQLGYLGAPVEELTAFQAMRLFARTNNPLTRRAYRRVWRRLAIEPWRRLLCLIGRLRVALGLPLTARIIHADVRVERFRLHAQWRPGRIDTPTVVFNAKEPETDAAATWRPYFRGPFTVHETPDPHRDEASVEAARNVILHHLKDVEHG